VETTCTACQLRQPRCQRNAKPAGVEPPSLECHPAQHVITANGHASAIPNLLGSSPLPWSATLHSMLSPPTATHTRAMPNLLGSSRLHWSYRLLGSLSWGSTHNSRRSLMLQPLQLTSCQQKANEVSNLDHVLRGWIHELRTELTESQGRNGMVVVLHRGVEHQQHNLRQRKKKSVERVVSKARLMTSGWRLRVLCTHNHSVADVPCASCPQTPAATAE
jgi:hypothetical protein